MKNFTEIITLKKVKKKMSLLVTLLQTFVTFFQIGNITNQRATKKQC